MRRSRQIALVLLGALSAEGITGCSREPTAAVVRISPERYFENNSYIPGAGYYHAPFHAFFLRPYNSYDAQRRLYYYGGNWGPAPYASVINISAPTAEAARLAESARTDIHWGGFGGSAGFFSGGS